MRQHMFLSFVWIFCLILLRLSADGAAQCVATIQPAKKMRFYDASDAIEMKNNYENESNQKTALKNWTKTLYNCDLRVYAELYG